MHVFASACQLSRVVINHSVHYEFNFGDASEIGLSPAHIEKIRSVFHNLDDRFFTHLFHVVDIHLKARREDGFYFLEL
jgi:hypothetical protein